MSLKNINTVDFISTDNEEKNVTLTITDELDWEDEINHLRLIQDKVNNYLSFIESGELYQTYPTSKGKKIEIEIYCKYELTINCEKLFKKLKRFLDDNGYGFNYKMLDE
ncbi:DUF6572 domain-containing protein [Clostridium cellulovorans]|uniref:Uncharacterized protein n=1 Tax=Clostridium cellulovorans (strain ATCC 35296 / DSM 3052 / OCM 3 / 743B) TaxID=573061 RepID=D9SWJ5_CLOC7|nr:DUF6572 domain-containing protein [Clostridium cellulovorans]ADL53277.1 hypothetical protein Clocel_3605 [Clostridium cellulovorans 743B]